MQGNNWGFLILLVVAVVIYALVQARRKPADDDEDVEGTETPEDGSIKDGQAAPDGEPPEPEDAEVPWADCQEQLSEAPPLSECEPVEIDEPDEAGAAPGDEPEEEAGRETEVEPVLPSNHALGAAIRVQAWRLFRENYQKILPLSGIVVLLIAVRLLIQMKVSFPDWLMGVIGYVDLFTALIAPVITLGAAFVAVRLWNGEAPRAGMLFHFLKERRFFPALGLMLLKALLQALPAFGVLGAYILIQKIFLSAPSDDSFRTMQLVNDLLSGVLIFYFCAVAWLVAWLEMAGFAFVRAPERGAMAAFKAGFQVGNRHFRSVMGMLIATGWPFGVVFVVRYIGSMWSAALHTPLAYLVAELLVLLLVLFYGGYVLISMAGLAARLLPDEAAPAEIEGTVSTDKSTDGGETAFADGSTADVPRETTPREADAAGEGDEKDTDD